jgi:histidinol phosphatase-like enzyme
MFMRAKEDLQIDLGASYMVGDDVRDMECKVTAGLKYGIMVVSDRYNDTPHADSIVPSFQDAARIIKQLEGQLQK